MRVSKLALFFVAMFLCVLMASTAMAFNVTNRSAEMDDFSPCDRAGTIEMRLTEADWNIIAAYLGANDYVRIRIALNGLSLPASPTLPKLCEDIHGTVDSTGIGALGGDLPYDEELVALQTIGVEVSDAESAGADGIADVTAYVHGDKDAQFIEVFITALDGAATDFDFDTAPPWFKIGLYQDLIDAGDTETTAICAQVISFSGVSTLTISNEADPNTLTFSGDNEIGHFLEQQVSLNECTKEDIAADSCVNTEVINNCPLGGTVQSPACPSYNKCFVMEGDLPTTGDIQIIIRTNGAADEDNTQEGIYLKDIDLVTEDGNPIIPTVDWVYLQADGETDVTAMPCEAWEAEYAIATIDAADAAADGNEVRFCVEYTANPDEIQVNTDVRFWVSALQLPCGSIVSGTVTGASIVECSVGAADTMYFPYVMTASEPWGSGIAITNLGSAVEPADMEATLTLTDSTGTAVTYTKSNFDTTIWVFMLDDILSEFSGTPAAGPAWLLVNTNFPVDGYEFVTNGIFGAGTLPRLNDVD